MDITKLFVIAAIVSVLTVAGTAAVISSLFNNISTISDHSNTAQAVKGGGGGGGTLPTCTTDANCKSGQICSGGVCVAPTASTCEQKNQFLDSKGRSCVTTCGNNEVPQNGQCVSCGSMIACNGQCVDTRTDTNNCGSCSNTCSTGEVCSNGVCTINSCPSGTSFCEGGCTDASIFQSDINNCGSCGNVCKSGEACQAGKCTTKCPTGQTLCGSRCVDLQSNVDNCNSCGRVCDDVVGEGAQCFSGVCECAPGLTACSSPGHEGDPNFTECTTLGSRDNCGACNNRCQDNEVCSNGSCVVSQCDSTIPGPNTGCPINGNICDPNTNTCTRCTSNDQCVAAGYGSDSICRNGLCSQCDSTNGVCNCSTNADCPSGQTCNVITGQCTAATV